MAKSKPSVCGPACTSAAVAQKLLSKQGFGGACARCGVFTSHQESVNSWQCLDRVCGLVRSMEQESRRRQHEAELRKETLQEAIRLRDSKQAADPQAEYVAVVVPHLDRPVAAREEKRVELLRDHISQRVAAVFGNQPGDWENPYSKEELPERTQTTELPVFSAGCTACQGKCCLQGEEHAFISTLTIEEFLRANPGLNESEVIDEYVRRIPEMAIKGSCLYHTQLGCALPLEMRSDMCNHYICPALKEIRQRIRERPPGGFFVAAELDGKLVSGEFVDL